MQAPRERQRRLIISEPYDASSRTAPPDTTISALRTMAITLSRRPDVDETMGRKASDTPVQRTDAGSLVPGEP